MAHDGEWSGEGIRSAAGKEGGVLGVRLGGCWGRSCTQSRLYSLFDVGKRRDRMKRKRIGIRVFSAKRKIDTWQRVRENRRYKGI